MVDSRAKCVSYRHDRLSGVRAAIAQDILRYATFSAEYQPELTFTTRLSIFFKPAILFISAHRFAHYLHLRRWKRLAQLLSRLNLLIHKAHISSQSCIGPGCFIGHCPGLTFHGTAGSNLTLLSLAICCANEQDFGSDAETGPQLGDGVVVGAHAVVIGPVNVGDNARVATNTWLSVDCPPGRLAYCAKVSYRAKPRFPPGTSLQQ